MKSRARRSAPRFRFRTAIFGSCSTARAWRCANVLRLTGLRIRRCNINRLKPLSEWTPNPRPPDDTSVVQEHRHWFQLQIVLLICRFTPTCPEVIRILSLGMDKPLPITTRIKLRIHYLMCSFCEHYAKQLNYMREVACEFPEKIGEISDATLPAEAKQRLKEALRQ
jgi:hypothetical protein